MSTTLLKVDLDFKEYVPYWVLPYYMMSRIVKAQKYLCVLDNFFEIKSIEVYRTRNGLHLYIYIDGDLPDWAILCLQSPIDDEFRMVFNVARLLGIHSGPFNVLFKDKYRIEYVGRKKISFEKHHEAKRLRILEKIFVRSLEKARKQKEIVFGD